MTTLAKQEKAYYYASKKEKFIDINGKTYPVKGKVEARRKAEPLNAIPWNF